jgi:hypothetical protein
MPQQRASDAVALLSRQNISVPDQLDVAHLLQAHQAGEMRAVVIAPEDDARSELPIERIA